MRVHYMTHEGRLSTAYLDPYAPRTVVLQRSGIDGLTGRDVRVELTPDGWVQVPFE